MTDPIIITAPTVCGVTVSQAKDHLRITHDDEDEVIEGFIDTATRDFEDYTNSTVYDTEREVAFDTFPSEFCGLPYSKPFISVTSIKYFDSANVEATVNPATYFVDTYRASVRLVEGESWPTFEPRASSAVVIRYKAGHVLGSPVTYVEAGIRTCICQMVGSLYLNRESVVPTDRSTIAAYAADPVARRLLKKYKKTYAF